MITPLLRDLAARTKEVWADGAWYPTKNRTWSGNEGYPDASRARSHCGTCELIDIHYAKANEAWIAQLICYYVCRNDLGLVLYYAPNQRKYKRTVDMLQQFGFKALHTGFHLGYKGVNQKNSGKFTLWANQFTPKEAKELKALKSKPSKGLAQNVPLQTVSSRFRADLNTVLSASIMSTPSVQ